MFHHTHPYKPFLFPETEKLIVGTLPPPRFTTGDLKEHDVNFCYGSRDGQLWSILDKIFKLDLKFETTTKAIQQRKDFLINRKIGICDIVASAERQKIDASDLGMQNIKLRNLISYLLKYPKVHTLLFTGGNSKNGPEYFFRKHLKEHNLKLEVVSDVVPRIHQFELPLSLPVIPTKEESHENSLEILKTRLIKTVSLMAPSGAANRAVGSLDNYKLMKQKNPKFTTLDYRIMQYGEFF